MHILSLQARGISRGAQGNHISPFPPFAEVDPPSIMAPEGQRTSPGFNSSPVRARVPHGTARKDRFNNIMRIRRQLLKQEWKGRFSLPI